MKSFLVLMATVLLATHPGLGAVGKPYQTGTIVEIQHKERTRVLYYMVNTPVTQDDPYYEVSVQLKDTIYVGEYNPRHSGDTLPEDWNPDASVQVRVEKHHLFAKRPGGVELDLVLVKRRSVQPAEGIPASPPAKK